MCELFAMSSMHPATVNYSLEQFSKHGGLTRENKDGWGISYYEDGDIRLIKEAKPAGNSPWVNFIAEQNLASDYVLAHVRMASRGTPRLKNTHPFGRELGGRWHVFAHNGTIADIETDMPMQGDRYHPVGETDSEYALCILLDRLHELWSGPDRPPPWQERMEVFARFAAEARTHGQANFLYSDGDVLFVHAHNRRYEKADGTLTEPRPPGLHVLTQRPSGAQQNVACDGLNVEVKDQAFMLFASVPLTTDPWVPLPEGTVLAVKDGRELARNTPDC